MEWNTIIQKYRRDKIEESNRENRAALEWSRLQHTKDFWKNINTTRRVIKYINRRGFSPNFLSGGSMQILQKYFKNRNIKLSIKKGIIELV